MRIFEYSILIFPVLRRKDHGFAAPIHYFLSSDFETSASKKAGSFLKESKSLSFMNASVFLPNSTDLRID